MHQRSSLSQSYISLLRQLYLCCNRLSEHLSLEQRTQLSRYTGSRRVLFGNTNDHNMRPSTHNFRSPERIVDPIMPSPQLNIFLASSERPCEALSYRLASPPICKCGEHRLLGSPVFLFYHHASAGETSPLQFFRARRAQNDRR